ncbi:hypothetical protein VPH35_008501 [Triticum aestivum]|uniref:Uncharacterized protein n=1 Tax=Triticum aestivum TaxID=4565 RepID=A0A3B5YWM8_WHEAT
MEMDFVSGPSGHEAWAQRLLHDDGELVLLGEVHLLAGDLLPLELPYHVGHEVLQVEHGDAQPGADPPAHAERHHLDLPIAGHVHRFACAAWQEPLRQELRWLLPLPLVPAHLGHHEVHRRPLGNQVPADLHVLRRLVRQHEVRRWVLPEALEHHRLEVRHLVDVLLRDLVLVVPLRGADLFVELLLDGRVLHQLGHDPLQPGGGGVGPGVEELGTEVDHLVVGQRAVSLLGELNVEQGVDVGVLERALFLGLAAEFPVLPPSVDQRHEQVLLPPLHGVHGLEAVAVEVLGHRRQEGEDGHLPRPVDEHEETEHGVLECLHDGRAAGGRLITQLLGQHAAHPGARGGEEADPRRVQRLGDEVAAQEAPHGAVAGARDGVVVLAQQLQRREGGAVRERGAALDERRVREAAVGDEDGEAGPHAQGHDGAVALEQAPEQGLHVGERVGQPHHAAQHRQGRRAGRDAEAAALAAAEE